MAHQRRDRVRNWKRYFNNKEATIYLGAGFDCNDFAVKFDYIIAQSIVTHCGPDLFHKFIINARNALDDNGVILMSVTQSEEQGRYCLKMVGIIQSVLRIIMNKY